MYLIIHPRLYIRSIEGKRSPANDHDTSKHVGSSDGLFVTSVHLLVLLYELFINAGTRIALIFN
jgi:hypothetical protein